jgi:hypothetical protein
MRSPTCRRSSRIIENTLAELHDIRRLAIQQLKMHGRNAAD